MICVISLYFSQFVYENNMKLYTYFFPSSINFFFLPWNSKFRVKKKAQFVFFFVWNTAHFADNICMYHLKENSNKNKKEQVEQNLDESWENCPRGQLFLKTFQTCFNKNTPTFLFLTWKSKKKVSKKKLKETGRMIKHGKYF